MWEIRKVYVVRVGMSVAYCGENEERAESVARMAEGRGKVWRAMVAVRFSENYGESPEIEYLAMCAGVDAPDPLDDAEIDITRGA